MHDGADAGFSLAEATLSVGVMSLGLLTLVPMLIFGMQTSRLAKNDRATAQIAQALFESARQGTLSEGTCYLDEQGQACASAAQAAYSAQATYQSVTGNSMLHRVKLLVTPVSSPDRARTYAVVLPLSS